VRVLDEVLLFDPPEGPVGRFADEIDQRCRTLEEAQVAVTTPGPAEVVDRQAQVEGLVLPESHHVVDAEAGTGQRGQGRFAGRMAGAALAVLFLAIESWFDGDAAGGLQLRHPPRLVGTQTDGVVIGLPALRADESVRGADLQLGGAEPHRRVGQEASGSDHLPEGLALAAGAPVIDFGKFMPTRRRIPAAFLDANHPLGMSGRRIRYEAVFQPRDGARPPLCTLADEVERLLTLLASVAEHRQDLWRQDSTVSLDDLPEQVAAGPAAAET